MKARSTVVGLIVLVLLAAGLAGWLYSKPEETQPNVVAPKAQAPAARDPGFALRSIPNPDASGGVVQLRTVDVTPRKSATNPAPLPPLNGALKNSYAELQSRARDGDVGAACRLAYELDRCRRLPSSRRRFREALAQLPNATGAREGSAGVAGERHAERDARCRERVRGLPRRAGE
jgi:hypothetical protein